MIRATGERESPGSLGDRRFALWLGAILLAGLALRLVYTWFQIRVDPWYALPVMDGRYYLRWAVALARGEGGPEGAYYLAPLYPLMLAALFRVAAVSFAAVYLLQHAMSLASAALLAIGGRRAVGDAGALAGASLFLLYHPLQFFAARPLGETLAILFLIGSLSTVRREGLPAALVGGLLAGLAALVRPNLLLVPLAWALIEARGRRWRGVLWVLAGVALAVAPVTVRNRLASGHWVPISSNAGITAYHGNGPGARGIYTHPFGLSLDMLRQREDAQALARARSGRPLDPVEADRWWGRQALRARLDEPVQTMGLLAWRLALTLDSREFGLDYPPMLDPNPTRLTIPVASGREVPVVPWGLLLGLSGAGVALVGWRRTGGGETWGAIAACAATPLLFYVSSRYRLPLVALTCVPAGAGLAALARWPRFSPARRASALLLAVALTGISFAIPSGSLYREQRAGGLGVRSHAALGTGRLEAAEADAREALRLAPDKASLWINLGAVLLATGEVEQAEQAYRRAIREQWTADAIPGLSESLERQGRGAEAEAVLRRALLLEPRHERCWNRLIELLYAAGDAAAARDLARQAASIGVRVDPGPSTRSGEAPSDREENGRP
jgi:tetratricopeptide (TPR) repeat protein